MPVTLVYMSRWPLCRAYNVHHDIFSTHEMLTELYISDFDHEQALRDVFADGAVIHVPKRVGCFVECIIWGDAAADESIVSGFADISSASTFCTTREETLNAMRKTFQHENHVRIVCVAGPLKEEAQSSDLSAFSLAANANVTQALAITNALDLVYAMKQATPDGDFFAIAHGARRFRNNTWEPCAQTIALSPHGQIILSAPTNIHTLPTAVLTTIETIDVGDHDLHHYEGATVTVDKMDDMWSCTCRLVYEGERYEVCRYFPAHRIDVLPRSFLSITDAADWRIRDSVAAADNLADSPDWIATGKGTGLLAACLPAIRELARRRTQLTEGFLVEAETNVAAAPIEPTPDDIVSPPEPEPEPEPEPVAVIPLETDWKETVRRIIRDAYGNVDAERFYSILDKLEEKTPYTLILGTDGVVQALQGALPPNVIIHLTKTSRQLSLPTNNGHATRVSSDSGGVTRIGRVNVDLATFVNCDRVVVYKGRARSQSTSTKREPPSYHRQRPQRGAVHRFARRMEVARALMYR